MPRILIVDDTADTLDVLAAYFALTDWCVGFASSGRMALECYDAARAAGRPYDALVLDIAMPDMTGSKVARLLRDGGDSETAIVFFTGYDRAQNRHNAEDVDAAAYLTKPVTPGELHRELERVLGIDD